NGNIYITYEVMGEISIKPELPKEESRVVFEGEKVDKMYVDMELEKKADKVKTYTKDEVDNKIRTIELLPGPPGKSVEYTWDGASLGVKREDETEYQFVNLQGPQGKEGPEGKQGPPGEQGPPGKS